MSRRRPAVPATLTPAAIEDVREILHWSAEKFGKQASRRYLALIIQALRDLEADPERVGSTERLEMVASARTYHLSFSRDRVTGEKVKSPRHFVLYRRSPESRIEVGRILHDGRDLARHIPADYRLPIRRVGSGEDYA